MRGGGGGGGGEGRGGGLFFISLIIFLWKIGLLFETAQLITALKKGTQEIGSSDHYGPMRADLLELKT